MKKRGFDRLQHIADRLDLQDEPVPGQTIVEIYGCHRILIEKHMGITQYTQCKICVKVSYGNLVICGKELELGHMKQDCLVIKGHIDGITICRRS